MSGDRLPDDARPGEEHLEGESGGEAIRSGNDRYEERRDPCGEDGAGTGPRGEDAERTKAPDPERAERGRTDGPDLLELDEYTLRTLLHDAVREVEPSPDSLERLHVAVPARRTRRRQQAVGAIAAALVIGVAAPALMQSGVVSRVLDGSTTHAAGSHVRGDGSKAGVQGGNGARQEDDREPGGTDGPAASAGSAGENGTAASPDVNDTLGPTSPSCLRSQLGDGGATLGTPEPGGRTYGSFRITNVSDSSCTVQGPDTVSADVTGPADPSGVSVVNHTSGDRAGELPDPGVEPRSIILEPGQSYVVRFAWVPDETGCPTSPEPDPASGDGSGGTGSGGTETGGTSGTGDTGGTGETGDGDSGKPGDTGTTTTGGGGTPGPDAGGSGEGGDTVEEPSGGPSPQLVYDGGSEGGSSATSVILRYVPAAGEPRIGKVEIAGACAGTVYRTGPLMAG